MSWTPAPQGAPPVVDLLHLLATLQRLALLAKLARAKATLLVARTA